MGRRGTFIEYDRDQREVSAIADTFKKAIRIVFADFQEFNRLTYPFDHEVNILGGRLLREIDRWAELPSFSVRDSNMGNKFNQFGSNKLDA